MMGPRTDTSSTLSANGERFTHGDRQGLPIRAGDPIEITTRVGDQRVTVAGIVAEVGADDGECWVLLEPGFGRWVENQHRIPDSLRGQHYRVGTYDADEVLHGADPSAVYFGGWAEVAYENADDEVHRLHERLAALGGRLSSLQDWADERWSLEQGR